jgi:hypothetical protein
VDGERVLLLLLGWLMGLAAPAITDGIKRKRENALGRAAIFGELREVAHKLALAAHRIYMHQGTVDRQKLEWITGVLERYAGVHESQRLLENFRKQLSWTDPEIAAAAKVVAAGDSRGLVLQKYAVPLLDGRVNALWSFDSSFTRQLLEIRASIELLTDLVERSRYYSGLTFGKLEDGNYDAVVSNFKQCCDEYAERAVQVVTRIEDLRVHV